MAQRIFTVLQRQPLAVVTAAAVLLRLAVLLLFPAVFAFEQTGDIHGSTAYDLYARNLVETGVYGREAGQPDAVLPPLYSALLAAVYSTLGRSSLAVGGLHILLDACSIIMLYHITRRLLAAAGPQRARWTALLAALFFAGYPYLIFQNLTLNDTALWVALLHAFVLLLALLRERPAMDRGTLLLAGAAGLVLGLATLARALLPPLALLAALWFLFRLDLRQTLLRLLPVALVGVLVVLPWTARAYGIYGQFVAVSLNSGENLYQGNNPQTLPILRAGYDVQWSDGPPTSTREMTPLERNNVLMQEGLRYLRENPQAIPELFWAKFQVHWSIEVAPLRNLRAGEQLRVVDGQVQIITGQGDHSGFDAAMDLYEDEPLFNRVGRTVHVLYYGSLFFLALAGLALSRLYWRDVALLWFVQISMTAMYVLFHPSTRYRSPSDPLLFVFSAYALVVLAGWLWARRARPAAAPAEE